jgi:hypothetical protein
MFTVAVKICTVSNAYSNNVADFADIGNRNTMAENLLPNN